MTMSLRRHYKSWSKCRGNERLKRKAFRRLRKTDVEGADVTCWGRLVQVRAAATGINIFAVLHKSMYTSHVDFHFSHTNGFIVRKLVLNNDISIFLLRRRELHRYGCRNFNSAVKLNVIVLFIDWSIGVGIIIS